MGLKYMSQEKHLFVLNKGIFTKIIATLLLLFISHSEMGIHLHIEMGQH